MKGVVKSNAPFCNRPMVIENCDEDHFGRKVITDFLPPRSLGKNGQAEDSKGEELFCDLFFATFSLLPGCGGSSIWSRMLTAVGADQPVKQHFLPSAHSGLSPNRDPQNWWFPCNFRFSHPYPQKDAPICRHSRRLLRLPTPDSSPEILDVGFGMSEAPQFGREVSLLSKRFVPRIGKRKTLLIKWKGTLQRE